MSTLPVESADHEEEPEEEPEPSSLERQEREFGRYTLCFELASGGMGNVYLSRVEGPADFEKLVAIKRIHRHLAKEKSFVNMFLDEARIASRISHPNVCTVFDFGEQDGVYYIAMEYLVGEPLSRVHRRVGATDEDPSRQMALFARISADAAEGLHAAHELRDRKGESLGVVHRDVSPHNLFITYDGGVRVVDFGIARAKDRVHETTTGMVKGKYPYMAPEQARGRSVDRRADVWSLGVVLWEGLALQRLFKRGNQTETILAVLSDPIPAPSQIRPEVPEALDEIVMRALSRDRDQRYSTCRDMGKDLSRYLSDQGLHIGLAELSEWMDQLFPHGRARKEQLMELAYARGSVPAVGETTPSDVGVARTRRASQPPTVRERVGDGAAPASKAPERETDSASSISVDVVEPTTTGTRRRRVTRSRATWAVAAVVAMGLAGGGWLAFAETGADEAPVDEQASVPEVAQPGDAPPVEGASPQPRTESAAGGTATGTGGAPDERAAVAADEPAGEGARGGPDEPATQGGDEAATDDAEQDARDDDAAARRRARRRAAARARRARQAEQSGGGSAAAGAGEPRAEPAELAGEGVVNVVTTGGWGVVWHEGKQVGETPARLELPAGQHVIEVRPFGRTPGKRIPVTVEAGSIEGVRVAVDQ